MRLFSTLGLALILGIAGCDQQAKKSTSTTVETPGGSTTVTTETKVEKSGDHKDNTATGTPADPTAPPAGTPVPGAEPNTAPAPATPANP